MFPQTDEVKKRAVQTSQRMLRGLPAVEETLSLRGLTGFFREYVPVF